MDAPSPLARRASAFAVGALAGILGLEAAFIASALFGWPFAPLAFARGIVDVTPGPVSSFLIDLLQFWAKRLAEAGALLIYVAAAGAAGALAPSRARTAALVGALPWVLGVVAAGAAAAGQTDPLSTGFDALVGALAFAVAHVAMREHAESAPARRRLVLIVGGLAVLAFAANGIAGLAARGARVAQRPLRLARAPAVTAAPFAPEDAAFQATPGLSPQLTATPDFYVVDTTFVKPAVDEDAWRLRLEGEVEQPYELTYDQLQALEAVEQVQTLECISNPIGGDLISTAKWVGVRVAELLARARPRPGAIDLVMTSHDGYTDSIPLAKALEPGTLLAYGMNDEVLPVEHGFPARMLIPDIYGMKNVKWLVRLSVVKKDWLGYWQERGWSDVAKYQIHSRIDVPQRTLRWTGGPIRIGGVAFAGARGITRVEVSTNGGTSWGDAKLGRAVNDVTWRRWVFEWTPPDAGTFRLVARATDGTGEPQIAARREPFPDGATGYHVVPLRVDRA